MAEVDLEELRKVALEHARRSLGRSGGPEVEDVAQCALADYAKHAETEEVRNAEGLLGVMVRRRARKYREDWKGESGSAASDRIGQVGERSVARRPERSASARDSVIVLLARADAELASYAIRQLRPVDREIARLLLEERPPLGLAEIAERMDQAPGAVQNRLVRIRRLVAELLGEDAE